MVDLFSRRAFVGGVGVSLVSCATSRSAQVADRAKLSAATPQTAAALVATLEPRAAAAFPVSGVNPTLVQRLAELENRVGGRLGVYALSEESGVILSYRADERFALCSTFKWLLAAVTLQAVDAGRLSLSQQVTFSERELLEHAPVCKQFAAQGQLSVAELAEAAVTVSDNTAANLLLDQLGGVSEFTRALRGFGDTVTRLDRKEPLLNMNEKGDERDTTTPLAMAESMRRVLLGTVLTDLSRERLLGWLIASSTGKERIRAGLPATWRVGDKTGTGMNGACNDVAAVWPAGRAPCVIAVYLSESTRALPELSQVHAEVGRLLASAYINV